MDGSHPASLLTHPSNLTKSPSSNTGSFRSHLSTTNSQQRLRAINSYTFPSNLKQIGSFPSRHPLDPELHDAHVLSQTSKLGSIVHMLFPVSRPGDSYSPYVRPWSNLALKWAACVYCCLSIVFMSVAIYKHLRDVEQVIQETRTFTTETLWQITQWGTHADPSNVSFLQALSTHQRLSRIMSAQPQLREFEPFLVRSKLEVDTTTVTACLWSQDTEVDLLPAWASRWPGPISLLLTTTLTRPSLAYDELLEKLQAGFFPAALSVHLLFVNPHTEFSPNMYLNIARLFALTHHVVLFPGNFSALPHQDMHRSIFAYSLSGSRLPGVLTSTQQKNWPFSPLAPVVFRRDYPLWCTERFFFSNSRGTNWEECLWQLSLETFGDMKAIQVPEWNYGGGVSLEFTNKVQRRLSNKYRTESCDLSVKRLAALDATDHRLGKRNNQWLKKFCRQVLEAAKD